MGKPHPVGLRLFALCILTSCATASTKTAQQGTASHPTAGPLRVHASNPRYFADRTGRAVYLTGSHSWANLQDLGLTDPPQAFDFPAYLDLLVSHHHNFVRLWRLDWTGLRDDSEDIWGAGLKTVAPHPWMRTGPGTANDGKPKFDLDQFDPAYFDRLRTRVSAARDRGIYVSIMLFEGWHLNGNPMGWDNHPFHASNNVNDVNGDVDGDGRGTEAYSLIDAAILERQKSYVRKVIDAVNDLDNVLYEIANENGVKTANEWQYHMITFIREYERGKSLQHPVGMSSLAWGFSNQAGNEILNASPAQWISLAQTTGFDGAADPYASSPPGADGRKVSILDTDHIGWKIFVNDAAFTRAWVWKSFLRGHNPILMENLKDREGWKAGRKAMGHARRYADRMDLGKATPQDALASTGYCLASVGSQYLVYQPEPGPFSVEVAAGDYSVEWFDPEAGVSVPGSSIGGGSKMEFTPPAAIRGSAVVYLERVNDAAKNR